MSITHARVCQTLSAEEAKIIELDCSKGAKSAQDWIDNLMKKTINNDAKMYVIERKLVSFSMGFMNWIVSVAPQYGVDIDSILTEMATEFMSTANTQVIMELIIEFTEGFWEYVEKRDLHYLGGEALAREIKVNAAIDGLIGKGLGILRAELKTEGTVNKEHLATVWTRLNAIVTYCKTYKTLLNNMTTLSS